MESNRSKVGASLLFLGSTHFLIHVFSQMLPAALPLLRGELGISLTQASLLVSVPLLVQVFVYLPAGVASDRWGAKVLVLGLLSTAVGAFIIPSGESYSLILFACVLLALGSTLYHPPALKMTSEVEPTRLGLAMGIQNAGGSLGYAIGPIVLGLTLPLWGWKSAFYVWVPLVLASAALSYNRSRVLIGQGGTVGVSSASKESRGRLLTRRFIAVLVIGASTDAAFMALSTYFTSYLTSMKGMPLSLASIVFGLGPLLGVAATIWGGAAADRLGRYRSIVLVTVLMAFTVALIPATENILVSSLLYILWRCLYSASMPLVNALVATHSRHVARGLAFSVYFIASNLASALAPMAASLFIESGLELIFPVTVFLLIPGVASSIQLMRLAKGVDATNRI